MYAIEYRNVGHFPAVMHLFNIMEKPDTLTPKQIENLVKLHLYELSRHLYMNNIDGAEVLSDHLQSHSLTHEDKRSEVRMNASITYKRQGRKYVITPQFICYIRKARIINLTSTSCEEEHSPVS